MHDVDRPHAPHLVHEAVVPVVDEVPAGDGRGPRERAVAEVARRAVPHLAGAAPRQRRGAGEHSAGRDRGDAADASDRAGHPRGAPPPGPVGAGLGWFDTGEREAVVGGRGRLAGFAADDPVGHGGGHDGGTGEAEERLAVAAFTESDLARDLVGDERGHEAGDAHGQAGDGVFAGVVGGRGAEPDRRGGAATDARLPSSRSRTGSPPP